ncbi:hypothetical protein IWQ60_003460 [Tieghemiomyces parasiticus]|uniref:SHSP domain-containing protein n=1 Tax=Tieghemiomyces parasiticus TaxID=78921 RepID=A0A9W8AD78_9FUNG|nr:hypothetical protein IWQ60_003460 [Tieghemiomyces parasiticus]
MPVEYTDRCFTVREARRKVVCTDGHPSRHLYDVENGSRLFDGDRGHHFIPVHPGHDRGHCHDHSCRHCRVHKPHHPHPDKHHHHHHHPSPDVESQLVHCRGRTDHCSDRCATGDGRPCNALASARIQVCEEGGCYRLTMHWPDPLVAPKKLAYKAECGRLHVSALGAPHVVGRTVHVHEERHREGLERVVRLPSDADTAHAKYSYHNGTLVVDFPRC